MCLLGQKRKNVFFKTYSLQDKIKMRNVGRKQKLAQKILKITKLERSLSDEWRVQQRSKFFLKDFTSVSEIITVALHANNSLTSAPAP